MLQTGALPKDEDWGILANFLALMYCRGLLFRAILKTVYEFGTNVLVEHLFSSEEIWKAIVGEMHQAEGIDIGIDYKEAVLTRNYFKFGMEIPNTYHVRLMLELASICVPVFAEMTPNPETVNTVVSDARFAISDCPIVAVSKSPNPPSTWRWPRNPDAELFFPLSSKACLVLNYDGLRKVSNVDRRRVGYVNHLMVLNSERQIISEERDFVWQRENGTISSSHSELLQFLKTTPNPATSRVNLDSLRSNIERWLKQHEIQGNPPK